MPEITRASGLTGTFGCAAAVADADAFSLRDKAGAIGYFPTGGTINVYVEIDGTYYQLYDDGGTAVTIASVAGKAHSFPTATYAAGNIKLVGTAQEVTIISKG